LRIIESGEGVLEIRLMDSHYSLRNELIIPYVFILGDEALGHLVVLDGQLMPALHEVSECPVEIEQFIEVASQRRVLFD
jgi:hypothetical protein